MILSTHKRTQSLEALKPKITAQQAVDYFSSHPEVLVEHPTLLAELILPFSSNPASLVERQIKKLRDQSAEYQSELLKVQQQLETQSRYFNFSIELLELLLPTQNSKNLFEALHTGLINHFNFEQAHLCIFGEEALSIHSSGPFVRRFPNQTFEPNDTKFDIKLGPLRDHDKHLFFQYPEAIQSAALIPISLKGPKIVLSIGDNSPLFFATDKDLFHLQLIQKTVSSLLQQHECSIQ